MMKKNFKIHKKIFKRTTNIGYESLKRQDTTKKTKKTKIMNNIAFTYNGTDNRPSNGFWLKMEKNMLYKKQKQNNNKKYIAFCTLSKEFLSPFYSSSQVRVLSPLMLLQTPDNINLYFAGHKINGWFFWFEATNQN